MIKKYIYCMGAVLLALLASCEKEGLAEYDETLRYLYIPHENEDGAVVDTVFFSFKQYVGINDSEIRFPIHLIGQALDKDATYRLEIIKERTTARPEDYTFEEEQTFHAGLWTDYVCVTLHRTEHLATEKVAFAFRLIPNENFGVGSFISQYTETLSASVGFCDMLSRPDWWEEDGIVELFYLGKYSDKKYECFIISSGISDLTGYSSTEIRKIVRKFRDDIKANGWTEADGSPMEVIIY